VSGVQRIYLRLALTRGHRNIGRMSEPTPTPQGHVVVVLTPNPDAQPSCRAYVEAEHDPIKARSLMARHVQPDEIMYVLAAFPDVLRQIQGLEPGGMMRL
jgi:hypothetical protein